jgi:hypothetical protein
MANESGGIVLGKMEVVCPHCENHKYNLETDKKTGSFKKFKGGDWSPLLTNLGEDDWVKDPEQGIAVKCKCRRHFFLYNIEHEELKVEDVLREGSYSVFYCQKCSLASVDSSMACPSCGKQY